MATHTHVNILARNTQAWKNNITFLDAVEFSGILHSVDSSLNWLKVWNEAVMVVFILTVPLYSCMCRVCVPVYVNVHKPRCGCCPML